MGEVWRKIPGMPGYEASSEGRIATPRGLRKARRNPNGRLQINGLPGRSSSMWVHVLVARAFLGHRPRGFDVAHKDGDKLNNRAANLMYCPRRVNMSHRRAHGTLPCPVVLLIERTSAEALRRAKKRCLRQLAKANGAILTRPPLSVWGARGTRKHRLCARRAGRNSGSRRLEDHDVVQIHRLLRRGYQLAKIARLMSVSSQTIRNIRDGKKWPHWNPRNRVLDFSAMGLWGARRVRQMCPTISRPT